MTNTAPLLRIGKSTSDLNKRQKEFNLLCEKIAKLDEQIPELENARDEIIRRIPIDLNPLVMEYQGIRVDIIHLMDRTYEADLYRKIYLTKLSYLITEGAFELIANYGFDELKPVYNKYSEIDIEKALLLASQQPEKVTDPAFLLEEDNPIVAEFPENFHEWDDAEQQRYKEERRAEKIQARIQKAKQQLDQQKTTKSVRTVYMDLVKAFHPDRESDEAEKVRKTEIMQRVTLAYQQNDLMTLLKLQIEFDQIGEEHLEKLTKNQLNYYNKVLSQQIADLEAKKEVVQKEISALCGLPYQHINSYITAVVKFNSNVNEMKSEIKNIKLVYKQWKTPSVLKAYLKTYQIPNEVHSDDDED
ncbi:hypothetical protein DSL64_23170 [Dyadobacter luteus]|uniref:J domain-containing protein n=1 Tax=Dyadobacter luteus TaxID=2259619 RepID=A0A3D8Y579_9BACT|nr:hypothetical protein [Dyadobacter luteus]REA57643.1 hypothetical protein DSL64_23170 [Dyadobacter luteus]